MTITRRDFLLTTAIAGTASLLPLYLSHPANAAYSYSTYDFSSPLAIPAEYHGRVENGKRVFDLSLQHGTTEFFNGYHTPTLGINGSYLGPVLRLKRGDEVVRLNDIEIWEFSNKSPMPHPVHIHDIQFRILSRNNRSPEANEHGLKDTVLVNPNETVRVITRFENYADETAAYMYHCHILEHEDQGMMAQFVVVS
jgi:FtsP/CotA-like multicopper oxidase with cupredoxin domain